jgi:site-specific DNA recombinase
MNYLIYTRVSQRGSDWSGETSCEAQSEECRRHILATDPAATFDVRTDTFVTATNNARPEIKRILSEIATSKWDVLVTLDMDRLARSQEGWIEIAKTLAAHNKGLICIRQNADFSSIQGRFMLSLFSIVGEYFARQNAQKTKDKMFYMARQGLWPCGLAPFGYLRTKKGDNVLTIDPVKGPIVEHIFKSYVGGESTTALSRRLNLQSTMIERILRNPIYLGRIVYGDIDAPGKHLPLITQPLFAAAASRLPGKTNTPRPQRHIYGYLLSGRVFCACGKTMSASHAVGGSGKKFPYYRCGEPRCTAARRLVRADVLDNSVMEQIANVTENDPAILNNWQRLVDMKRTLEQQNDNELPGWRAERDAAQTKADNLALALQGGALGPVAMKRLSQDLETLYGQAAAFTVKIDARESDLAALTPPDTAAQLARDWKHTARLLADPSKPLEDRQAWAAAHVQRVETDGDGWKVFFAVSSRNSLEWHPGRGSNARPAV